MYAMIRVLTNKMASAWANTTSTSGRIYGIQLVAGGSIGAGSVVLAHPVQLVTSQVQYRDRTGLARAARPSTPQWRQLTRPTAVRKERRTLIVLFISLKLVVRQYDSVCSCKHHYVVACLK